MIKKHLKLLIITSIVILSPILVGLVLWASLPQDLPIHWNLNGEVDRFASKPFVVLAMPAILAAFQWVAIILTMSDPKRKNHSPKVLQAVFWIIPIVSIAIAFITYSGALGLGVRVDKILPALLGLIFVIIGNYLPKCKQSYTVGIRLSWTLNNEENWNKTHRLAGWVMVICGFLMMAVGVFGVVWLTLPIALVMILVPLIYSYVLHRRGL